MEEEQKTIAPDVVFPFGRTKKWEGDSKFEEDLRLELILKRHPYSRKIPDSFGRSYYCSEKSRLNDAISLNTDIETAQYRQEIFKDLENPEIRGKFDRLLSNLERLYYAKENHRGISSGLRMLEEYIHILEDTPDFSDAKSRGLRGISRYLSECKESEDTTKIKDLIDSLRNVDRVEFKVSFNESLQPERMSILELKTKPKADETFEEKPQKRNLFERLFGTKQYEETMSQQLEKSEGDVLYKIDYDGKRRLNDLGEIIDRFMSEQFGGAINSYTTKIREINSLFTHLKFYDGFMKYFDDLRKKGFDICLPTLLPKEERRTSIQGVRNPQLIEAKNNGNKVVPNDIKTNPEGNMYILTGPNNGGKTTYIKTVGLVQLLAQSGLPIPATAGEISMVDGIYTHFVAPDDITKGEGRYRNELRRMKEIFDRATPYSLILLDEPCGGTSYEEGQKQSLVLLDGFHKLGSSTFFTTHIHPLTKEVDNGRYSGARNLQVECRDDGEKIEYTYRVISGSSGKSYGEEIAREIGLRSENILETLSKNAEKRGYKELLR